MLFGFAELEVNWMTFFNKLVDPTTLTLIGGIIGGVIGYFKLRLEMLRNTKETVEAKQAAVEAKDAASGASDKLDSAKQATEQSGKQAIQTAVKATAKAEEAVVKVATAHQETLIALSEEIGSVKQAIAEMKDGFTKFLKDKTEQNDRLVSKVEDLIRLTAEHNRRIEASERRLAHIESNTETILRNGATELGK